MQLRHLSAGMRFMLCRTKEKYHLIDMRSQCHRKAVVNNKLEPKSLHCNCIVKPVIRCSTDVSEVNIQLVRVKTAMRLAAKAPLSFTQGRVNG